MVEGKRDTRKKVENGSLLWFKDRNAQMKKELPEKKINFKLILQAYRDSMISKVMGLFGPLLPDIQL